ncbi:hypothetical protein ACS0TY_006197 [Phlomoides rotata]
MRSIVRSGGEKGIAVIVGVGPQLEQVIAHKFFREGYVTAILYRDLDNVSKIADEIANEENLQVFAIRMDCSVTRSIQDAFEGIHSLGFVQVLVYNAYNPEAGTRFSNIHFDQFQKSLAISALSTFHCTQEVYFPF